MDAGDADVEIEGGAVLGDDLVVARAALRVREASTQASGRARAHDGSRMDAGDADVEVAGEALVRLERVGARTSLRVREASTRASGRARAWTRRRRTGIPDGRGRR